MHFLSTSRPQALSRVYIKRPSDESVRHRCHFSDKETEASQEVQPPTHFPRTSEAISSALPRPLEQVPTFEVTTGKPVKERPVSSFPLCPVHFLSPLPLVPPNPPRCCSPGTQQSTSLPSHVGDKTRRGVINILIIF